MGASALAQVLVQASVMALEYGPAFQYAEALRALHQPGAVKIRSVPEDLVCDQSHDRVEEVRNLLGSDAEYDAPVLDPVRALVLARAHAHYLVVVLAVHFHEAHVRHWQIVADH